MRIPAPFLASSSARPKSENTGRDPLGRMPPPVAVIQRSQSSIQSSSLSQVSAVRSARARRRSAVPGEQTGNISSRFRQIASSVSEGFSRNRLRSKGSRIRFGGVCRVVTEISNPPTTCLSADRRGDSQNCAMLGSAAILIAWGRALRTSACTEVPSRSNASVRSGTDCRAASVSVTPCAWRSNSFMPAQASSDLICWVMAAGVTQSSSAAVEKLPSLAAASKARSALSGGMLGRLWFIAITRFRYSIPSSM